MIRGRLLTRFLRETASSDYITSRYNDVAVNENIQTYWSSLAAVLEDLGTSPRSSLIRYQREGQVCLDSLDTMTKWECELRNYSVMLKFSVARQYCPSMSPYHIVKN